jgi:hypothetical protein
VRTAWANMEESERLERATLEVRKGFQSRFEAIECGMFVQGAHPAFYTVAKWVLSVGGDPRQVIAGLLNGFFADSYAKDRHFPIRLLAACPQQYYKGARAPAEKSPELQKLIEDRAAREGGRRGP